MKLTSKEMKNIIKEELERLLLESRTSQAATSLSNKVLKAFKEKEKNRFSMVDELLNYFDKLPIDPAWIKNPDKEFLFKWMRKMNTVYPEFAMEISIRTPDSGKIRYGTKKRKSLQDFHRSYSYEEYQKKSIARAEKEEREKYKAWLALGKKREREKLEQERKKFIDNLKAATARQRNRRTSI